MARTPDQPVSTERGRQRRAQLLDAARQVFEDMRYSNATVSDIVRVAGGSRASFYSYFTSADDVLEELVRELADELFEASTRPLEPADSPFETLASTIRQFMHAYRDLAPLLAVLDQATVASDAFRSVRVGIRMRFAEAIAAGVKRGPNGTDAAGPAPTTMAIALGGLVEDMARGRYLLGQDIDEDEASHALATIWARAIGLPVR